jgi:acyl-CoA thioesterase-1
VLRTPPSKLCATIRELIHTIPEQAVTLDLPVPTGFWGIAGRASAPCVTRINEVVHIAAIQRGLPVAHVLAHFTPLWTSKFAPGQLIQR